MGDVRGWSIAAFLLDSSLTTLFRSFDTFDSVLGLFLLNAEQAQKAQKAQNGVKIKLINTKKKKDY